MPFKNPKNESAANPYAVGNGLLLDLVEEKLVRRFELGSES